MVNSINIQFRNGTNQECVGFSREKQNNFYKTITSIFHNADKNTETSYVIKSIQCSEHDFIQLVSGEEVLNSVTTKINDVLFHKTFTFTIKPNSEKKISITPLWETKAELSKNRILTDFKTTLVIDHFFQKIQYELFCFQNIETNHNPYAPPPSEEDLTNYVLKTTEQKNEPLKDLTNATKTPRKKNTKPKERIISFTPGVKGVKKKTPSPEVPDGAEKSCFSTFSNLKGTNSSRPLNQIPNQISYLITDLTQAIKPKPRVLPRPDSNPPPPKRKKLETPVLSSEIMKITSILN